MTLVGMPELAELIAIAPHRPASQGFTMPARDPLETDGIFFTLEHLARAALVWQDLNPGRDWRAFTRYCAGLE